MEVNSPASLQWTELAFGALYDEPSRNGLMRPKSVRGSGVAMVNMGEIFAHDRIGDVPMERVPLSESEANRFLLRDGDLLFARASLTLEGAGKVSILMPAPYPRTFESHIIRVRLDQKRVAPAFYYYFFRSDAGRTTMASIVEQVSAAGIRASDLARLLVPLPPLPEQQAIARVLGGLDDKIELNRRMNRTLEDLARGLFVEWLDRFANNIESVSAQSLIDSGTLVIGDGYRAKRSELRPTGLPFARAGNVDGGFQFDDCEYMGPEGVRAAGDKISCPLDSVFTSKGTVGRLALVSKSTPTFVYAPQLCFWRVKDSSRFDPYVLHQWMHGEEFGEQVDMTKGQTDMADYVSLTDQRRMRLTLPPPEHQVKIGRYLARLYEMIDQNTAQARSLAAIRDAILPILLSGEVRLAVADQTLVKVG